MTREEMISDYRNCLRFLCSQSAFLEEVKKNVECGVISVEELAPQLSLMEVAKSEFLRLKNLLGYEGGLSFMQDVKFLGFEFKNGSLQGDYTNLFPIVSSFISEFDEDKVYQYEVGTLVFFHYMRQQGIDNGSSKPVSLLRRKVKKIKEKVREGVVWLWNSLK